MVDTIRLLTVLAVVVMVALAGCSGGGTDGDIAEDGDANLGGDGADGAAAESADGELGYAVGGAQDVNNFRDNVEEGYLPVRSDVTHEGLFYDYYFETGKDDCTELFCPAYSRAVTADPLSNETERYLSVGLNSNISQEEFERENLNLVVVLDVSGSMDSPMPEYYYDEDGEGTAEGSTTKMAAANDAVVTLTEQLDDEDRFGLVTFNGDARTEVDLERMDERDEEAMRDDIQSIRAGGGTNLAAGMDEATEMVEPHVDEEGYDTRVVYVTDAMPNLGDTSEGGLHDRLVEDADRGIHSTFVGVGMDFNTETVESISSVRGANYYAVHSAEEFDERMGEEFEYMVTPMVFDLSLELEAEGYEIERVYGSPEADEATGEIMHVNTLFPSPTENGSTKGGIILLELERTAEDADLELTASYEDRDGERHETTADVEFADAEPDHFDDDAVRKGVLLTRYASLMGNWIEYERASMADGTVEEPAEGIEAPDGELGKWERQSSELVVSPEYAERIDAFREHFAAEADAIGDEDLQRELELMETILEHSDAVSVEDGDRDADANGTTEAGAGTNESDGTGANDETDEDDGTETATEEADVRVVVPG